LEARPALLVEGDDLAVEDRVARAQLAAEGAQLGPAGGDVLQVAALDPHPAGLRAEDRADAVPLDLVPVGGVVARQLLRQLGEHRLDALRHRLAVGVGGRVHAMDHPVVPAGAEQCVLALHPLAVERDDDLVLLELVAVVGPAVPDDHLAGPVVALGDLSLEVDVVERMVLDVHGQVVALGVLRDPLWQGPRDEHTVPLQPEVPVQPPGVVLLDDEAPGVALSAVGARGLRCVLEIPLVAVRA
jgi:hypothetical protein